MKENSTTSGGILAAGAFLAGGAVALGAFGAHGLKGILSEHALALFETGVRYQFYHAVALLAAGILLVLRNDERFRRMATAASWLFAIGILLFSGSLYAMALGSWTQLGAVTPFGGFSFLTGWLILGVACLKKVKT